MDYRTDEEIRRDEEEYERQHPAAKAKFVIKLIFAGAPSAFLRLSLETICHGGLA